ncbi:DsbA family protein [Marinobacterium arenosum]|uniref:DsbA family protein n=1 Tax=Marinobacterium arenosum TaxID=2862496 RepID=UPI001C953AD9|nr:DsbA family protein [Marinobacterium arenosum]MBY4677102.1 DsbA family protein [Marinobacterium arenosum]
MSARLYYVHDPMCSWCWGFKPGWEELRERLPAQVEVVPLLGGLAPDSDAPMPVEMQQYLQQTWRRIEQMLGTEFNFDFWRQCQPRRDTWKACRAVIAAQHQQQGEAMTGAIQRAYYTRALNPSEPETLCQLAEELALDVERFRADLNDPATQDELERQMALADRLEVQGFPSLVLVVGQRAVPIRVDYRQPETMLAAIETLLAQEEN